MRSFDTLSRVDATVASVLFGKGCGLKIRRTG